MFRELNQALDFFLGIPLCIHMTEVIFKIKCNGSPLSFLFVSMHKYLKYLISGVCMQVYFTVAFCEKKKLIGVCSFMWNSVLSVRLSGSPEGTIYLINLLPLESGSSIDVNENMLLITLLQHF